MTERIAIIFENGKLQAVIRLPAPMGAAGGLHFRKQPTAEEFAAALDAIEVGGERGSHPDVALCAHCMWIEGQGHAPWCKHGTAHPDTHGRTYVPKPHHDLTDLQSLSDETLKRLYWNAQRVADTCSQLDDEIHARGSEARYKAEIDRRGLEVGRAP